MPAAVARRTRYDTPKWAERFPDTKEGLEAMSAHGEARKIPRHTDPDSIDDPEVRDAFLEQLRDETDDDSGGRSPARSARRGNRSAGSSPRALRLPFASSIGSAVFGLVVYAIGINFVRGGGAQVKRWTSAKFTNGQGKLP